MSKTRGNLLDYFLAEGYPAQVDSDGDIVFKCEGIGYALCFDANDPCFGKLILPNVWHVEGADALGLCLPVLDHINRRLKVVKAHTVGDYVWFTVEIWLTEQAEWRNYMQRAVCSLAHARTEFADRMRELHKGLSALHIVQ